MSARTLFEQLEADLHSLRADVDGLRARREADRYRQHLETCERIYMQAADMSLLESRYFASGGKSVPILLLRLQDLVRKYVKKLWKKYGF